MKKYKTEFGWKNEIASYEIIKETAHRITFNGKHGERTENKISQYHKWHDTFDEAKEFLINREKNKIECAKREWENAELEIARLSALSPL